MRKSGNSCWAKHLAVKELTKINKNSLDLDGLLQLFSQYGFDVIDYDLPEQSQYVAALIEKLSLQKFVQQRTAFVYQRQEIKLVFVYEQMTAEEKLYALSHELGHIVCRHLRAGQGGHYTIEEEQEANEFAHYLLHPPLLSQGKIWCVNHKRAMVKALLCLVAVTLAVFFVAWHQQQRLYYGAYYVTEYGEKYHVKDCRYIQDKPNVHRLTKEEYASGDYTPCQICMKKQEQ